MKKIIIYLLSLIMVFSFVGCSDSQTNTNDKNKEENIYTVASVELDCKSKEMYVGQALKLFAKVKMSDDVITQDVIWSSSNENVATVTNGKVSALTIGTTTITAKAKADEEKTSSCTINVVEKTLSDVVEVNLNYDHMEVVQGTENELIATVVMKDYTTTKDVQWVSSNPEILTCENGKIKALSKGEANIIATSTVDNSKKAVCEISVVPYTSEKEFKILFMGDSISDGGRGRGNWESYNNKMGQTYTKFVSGNLTKQFPEKNLKFCSRGIGGQNISQMLARSDADIIDLKPDVVNILAGVNDSPAASSLVASDPDDFRKAYKAMLEKIRTNLPETKIIICETFLGNVGSERPFYYEAFEYVKQFQVIERELAEEYDALFIPIHDMFEQAYIPENETYWLWDGVHPSVAGHGLLAKHWMMSAVDFIFDEK